jgi:small-conductance mechanosensitive channel
MSTCHGETRGSAASVLLTIAALASSGTAFAQVSSETPPVAAQEAPIPGSRQPPTDGWHDLFTQLVTEFRRMAGGWQVLAEEVQSQLAAHGDDGTANWFFPAFLTGLMALAVGALIALLFAWWLRRRFSTVSERPPKNRLERLSRIYAASLLRLALIAVLLVGAIVPAAAFGDDSVGWHVTVGGILLTAASVGVIWVILSSCLEPHASHLRIVAFSDTEAVRLFRHLMAVGVIGACLLGIHRWTLLLGVSIEALKPPLVVITALMAGALIVIAVANRKPVARLIAGTAERDGSPLRRAIGRAWPVLASICFLLSAILGIFRILLDRPNAIGLVGMPILAIIISFAVYGVALVLIDSLEARRQARIRSAETLVESVGEPGAAAGVTRRSDEEIGNAAILVASRRADEVAPETDHFSLLQPLLERAAATGSIALGFYLLARLWGIDEAVGANVSSAVVEIVAVLLLAYVAYQAAKLWIDRKIADEVRRAMATGASLGAASSRLGTLLPIFRIFLLVTLLTITAMIVLSRMGIDIGPLLAGAGIVGVAVGFGSQTLVKDIISGAFFLVDDAFRIGEYIDLGAAAGTVEKINIRSMQLRHADGPLATVPFSTISLVSNLSRDFAVVKLTLRLPYDADLQRAAKIIKLLGQDLLQDPEIGGYFLEPVKSQGIQALEDSAMILRVKFMTTPGHQYEVSRAVYGRILERFNQEGIRFAPREVRVSIADSDPDDPKPKSSKQRTRAATAAAHADIDEA